MAGHARKDIVREGEIGIYHTWSRCVQRAFLCGFDPLTRRDFHHRRAWIKSLLEYQASVFAVDIGNYSILSNHQHLIARTRPDIAAMWTDEEVAWRWRLAWPQFIDGQWVREPTDQEIEETLSHPEKLPRLRACLASLSWLMARWKEPIARMANREMETTGHYYEQRFGSREIFDDGSHLCNHGYVDLNQYRAGMATSLEASTCSGIHDRLQAWRQQEIRESLAAFHGSVPKGYELESSQVERLLADCFLSPISDQGPGLLMPELKIVYEPKVLIYYSGPPVVSSGSDNNAIILNVHQELEEEELAGDEADQSPTEPTTPSETPVANSSSSRGLPRKRRPKVTRRRHRRLQKRRRRRASDVPILAIPLKQYLDLMQGTVERLNAHSLEPEPDSTVPLDLEAKGDSSAWAALAKYGIDPACWCELVGHCGDWTHRGVGAPEKIAPRPAAGGMKSPSGSKTAGAGFT